MNQNSFFPRLKVAAYISLIVLTCECVIGSSGRWLEIGGLSIRMVLFIIAFLLSLPIVIKEIKGLIKNRIVWSIIIFGLFACLAVVNGYLRGNNTNFIRADLTSILFLVLVPAYIVIIDTKEKINTLLKYASYSSIVLACIVIIIHFTLNYLGEDAKMWFNNIINNASIGGLFNFGDGIFKIYFKSSICFILPFLYNLNLAITYKKTHEKRLVWPYVFMSISLLGSILSYTRSIWLGFFIAVLLYAVINIKHCKRLIKAIAFSVLGLIIFISVSWAVYGFEGVINNAVNRVLLGRAYIESQESGHADFNTQRMIEIESEEIRSDRMEAARMKIKENWVLGSGFGDTLELDKSEGKIEYTYMDILCKMGIFGLISFIAVLLIPLYYVVLRLKKNEHFNSMVVLACVMICIYASSYYNPFITSPIGFSLFAVMVASIFVRKDHYLNDDSAQ